MPNISMRLAAVLSALLGGSPVVRRLAWHARRIGGAVNRRLYLALFEFGAALVIGVALLVTLIEKDWRGGLGPFLGSLASSLNWAFFTLLGQGDPAYVTSAAGIAISWFLVLIGVAILTAMTGALIAVVIDLLLKEGQGLGASGYRDHVVVCGWNATARDLISELSGDEYPAKVVVLADLEKNPAPGAYFVRGDTADQEDLRRAGIEEAAAALVFPTTETDEADMHSIVTLLAIEAIAPKVRTVAEVNNPRHVEHFRRTNVDEMLVTTRLASHLLARSALYPGLTSLVTDIVSGGEGSELYRVGLPGEMVGLGIDEASSRFRSSHRATLLAVSRAGRTFVNPPPEFVLEEGDEALVVATTLGKLRPLRAMPT